MWLAMSLTCCSARGLDEKTEVDSVEMSILCEEDVECDLLTLCCSYVPLRLG